MVGHRRRPREEAHGNSLSNTAGPSTMVPDNSPLEPTPDLKSDIENILSALQQVRQKTISDGQKKCEEVLTSTTADIKALVEQAKVKIQAERDALSKQTSKLCKEYETALKDEAAKYKATYTAFCQAKDTHLQAYEEIYSKFEETKEKLLTKFDLLRKKERTAYADVESVCTQKFHEAEQAIKKMKQDEKSFHMLRKSLGTIFADSSDEETETMG
ncbi:hypothetical protein R1flu_017463 [Riccia fluitans]|uniref:Uncharacterized protein n=1 Tax=Riccia fluitans TaxID=41844 RepID=A0ABD1ZD13_9MARC